MLPRSKTENDFLEHILANVRTKFGYDYGSHQLIFMVGAKLHNEWIDMESLKPLTFMRWCSGNPHGIQLSILDICNLYGFLAFDSVILSTNGLMESQSGDTFLNHVICLRPV